jgi:hypothetical protein
MIQANDVVIVLRPDLDAEGKYDGDFKVIHSVIGPVTMQAEHVYDMACLALIMSLMLEFVEKSDKLLVEEFTAFVEKTHPKVFEEVAVALVSSGGVDTTTISTRVH